MRNRIEPTESELAWLIRQTAKHGFALDLDFGPSFVALSESSPHFDEACKLLAYKRGLLAKGMGGDGI